MFLKTGRDTFILLEPAVEQPIFCAISKVKPKVPHQTKVQV